MRLWRRRVGGGGNTSSNNNGSTNITITIPKAASSSTDINLLGDFTPTYATANFHYGIYFKNNSVTSETQYATAGQSVTFNDVKYDTYEFCLDIYVDSYKKTKLDDTITVNKTISASDNTVQFPDMSVSTYSKWYFVKDSAELTTAISKIEAGGYTEATPAKLCLTASIEDARATVIKNNNKIDIVYNNFELEPHLYNITISPVTGGTVTADREKASAGKTVTLTLNAADGRKFESLSVSKGSDAAAGVGRTTVEEGKKYTFTMPDDDVTVSAVFRAKYVYTVTFTDSEENQVGSLEVIEDEELSFAAAKTAVTPTTGREIVAFKERSPTPDTIYKEENFPITFNSTNFSELGVNFLVCLDLTHSRVDGGGGYETVNYLFNTQTGTSTNPYLLNYYGNDTNKRNQVTIEINGHICADNALTIEPETGKSTIVATDFDSISCTDSKILIRIKSDLATDSVYNGTIKLTVTDPTTGATTDFYVWILKGKFGSKDAPDAVGDIVFKDGTAEAYTADLELSDAHKNAAIAVIFDVSGSNPKGVGLTQGTNLQWCTTDAAAYNVKTYATSEVDGSANMTSIKGAGDWGTDGAKYPAFAYADSYSASNYTSGWYLPAKDELQTIYDNLSTVNRALGKTGATQLNARYYWSSSQLTSDVNAACNFEFRTATPGHHWKYTSTDHSVCVIHTF